MNFVNNYLEPITLAVGATTADLNLPNGEYLLTLADSRSEPTRWEIVRAVVLDGNAVLERGQQDTDDQPWVSGSVIYCSLTAGTLLDLLTRLGTVEGVATGPLTIIDELASTGDLPVSGSGGDAYLIAGHVWVWATAGAEWVDGGSYEGTAGEPGRDPEFQASATHVQWSLAGDTEWIDLLPLSEITGPAGDDGRAAEFQASATHLQYRLVGDAEWLDLLPLSELQGPAGDDGREIEVRASATHIQWRYVGDPAWTDVVALAALKGDAGDDGVPVEFQASATHIQWRLLGAATWTDLVPLSEIAVVSGGWDALATPAISAGALALDLSAPTLFAVTLDQDLTDLSFTGLPAGTAPTFAVAFTQDATGGRAVTWPASVIGTPPDIATDAAAKTVVSLAHVGGGQFIISGAIYA